jgi:hypothetical protein
MITDKIDEYLKLRKSTAIECIEYYYAGIIECFRSEFLHRSTVTDTHTVTSVVAPPITYEAPTSLTTTKGGAFDFWINIFKSSIRLDRVCVEQVPLD